jgi:hypothetical protein
VVRRLAINFWQAGALHVMDRSCQIGNLLHDPRYDLRKVYAIPTLPLSGRQGAWGGEAES